MTAEKIIVFARQPELGKVKTRLAAGIGEARALAVYQELLAITREAINAAGVAATVWLAGIDGRDDYEAEWPGFTCQAQPAGDLGQRMSTAFATAFAEGARRVIIVGTDCPELSELHLRQAFEQLQTHDVVLGPAEDGGYYLLGMRGQLHPALFANKAWSTSTVLADTLADARRLGLRVTLLPELSDIDHAADLAAWRERTYKR